MESKSKLHTLIMKTTAGKDLSEYHLSLLKKRNITTPLEFMTANNLNKLLAINVEDIVNIKRELQPLLVSSAKLNELYQPEPFNYSTGIKELDALLDRIGQPLRPGRVWELCGETDVGKTELLYTLAVNFVSQYKESNQQVLFIDNKHSFSSRRFNQILLERKLDTATINKCLSVIHVAEVTTAKNFIETLEGMLETCFTYADNNDMANIKLVIVDSVTASFMFTCSNFGRNQGRYFLTELAMLVRKLASKYGIAFVLGNLTMSCEDDSDEDGTEATDELQFQTGSMLGAYWSSVSTLTLALELPEGNNSDGLRQVNVLKNCYGISTGSCVLRITDAGVI